HRKRDLTTGHRTLRIPHMIRIARATAQPGNKYQAQRHTQPSYFMKRSGSIAQSIILEVAELDPSASTSTNQTLCQLRFILKTNLAGRYVNHLHEHEILNPTLVFYTLGNVINLTGHKKL